MSFEEEFFMSLEEFMFLSLEEFFMEFMSEFMSEFSTRRSYGGHRLSAASQTGYRFSAARPSESCSEPGVAPISMAARQKARRERKRVSCT